jgi:hypothetical protein
MVALVFLVSGVAGADECSPQSQVHQFSNRFLNEVTKKLLSRSVSKGGNVKVNRVVFDPKARAIVTETEVSTGLAPDDISMTLNIVMHLRGVLEKANLEQCKDEDLRAFLKDGVVLVEERTIQGVEVEAVTTEKMCLSAGLTVPAKAEAVQGQGSP